MAVTAGSVRARGVTPLLSAPRLVFAIGVSAMYGGLSGLLAQAPAVQVTIALAVVMGLAATLTFGVLEQHPKRLPLWLPRWILQIAGVVVAVPVAVLLSQLAVMGTNVHATHDEAQLLSLGYLMFGGILFAPWIALGAMVRQRETFVRDQALKFELERSELERNALDARLRLLQAQVEPHFLFNTLANVQALVDIGSPQAPKVLASLIAYLRAAVPQVQEPETTLGRELDLVRAYLELMKMRMPDRLDFVLHVDPATNLQQCPPVTLLTLVENAVRHGIDPSEDGGQIAIEARNSDGRCVVRVTDTGVGVTAHDGPGTGLSTLRERLDLAFGGDARLEVTPAKPRGTRAEIDMPARQLAQ